MQRRSVRPARRAGFTLLEVLLVLAILGVIAAIVVPRLLGQQKTANIKAAQASVHSFEQTLELYAVNHNATYPEGDIEAAMQALMSTTDTQGNKQEVLLTEQPLDPWGRVLNYEYPTDKTADGRPAIWSNGESEDDESDDINNWNQDQAGV